MKKSFSIALFAAGIGTLPYSNAQSRNDIPRPETVDVNAARPKDSYMLHWQQVMESDIAWKKRVWRNIDPMDERNAPFRYDRSIGNESNPAYFIADGAAKGAYKAYSPADDRFTIPLSAQEAQILAGGTFNPEKVSSYRIKEDWLYLQQEHRMVVRIIGIAPMVEVIDDNGISSPQPAFWVYYPDAREYFAAHEVFNAGSRTGVNWDELFERGNFKGASDKIIDTKTE